MTPRPPLIASILIASCLFLAGCPAVNSTTQPSQSQTVANVDAAIEAYNLVLTGIDVAKSAGWVTPAEIAPYDPVINAIAAALHAAKNDAAAGNVSAAQTALDEVTAALPQLAPLLSKINARKPATTKPA